MILFPHQVEMLKFIEHRKQSGLFAEMGLGKTAVAIRHAVCLHASGEIDRVFIIAPNGVHKGWALDQIQKFLLQPCNIYVIDQHKWLPVVQTDPKNLTFLCINIDKFSRAVSPSVLKVINDRTLVILDESHLIKNPSKRTKSILKIQAPYKLILSGTPVSNRLADLYNQLKFIGVTSLGRNMTEFKRNHCIMGGYLNYQIMGYRNIDKIEEAVKDTCIVQKTKDCLKLPDVVYKRHYAEFSPVQEAFYKQVKKAKLEEYADKKISITNVASILTSLRQVAGGFLNGSPIPGKNHKIDLIKNIIENHSDDCIMVWAVYRSELEYLSKELNCPMIYGDTPGAERVKILSQFKNDGNKLLVANPTVLGTGYNLQQASVAIFYSNNFSYVDRIQAEKRTHRIGQKKINFVYDILTDKTTDTILLEILSKKQSLTEILNKNNWREYL